MLKKIMAFYFLGIISPAILANDYSQSFGYYKGFWLGIASGITIREDRLELADENHYGPTGKIEFGYQFHDYASLYSSYDYMDVVRNKKINIGTLGIKSNYFLTDNLSIFSNIGMSHYFTNGYDGIYESYSYGGVIGTGLEYNISKAFSIKVGYNYFDNIKITSGSDTHLHQIYLGVTHKFGQKYQPVQKEIMSPKIEYVERIEIENQVQLVGNNRIIAFSLGQSKIVSNTLADFYLQEVINLMREIPQLKAELKGRTDKIGSDIINQRISVERAKTVYDYLINNGIDAERLSWSSVSYHEPITENNSDIERSVEIRFR
ncbi:OmpA family protein [Vibrio metschnikovii]|uniref:OmpA family protein n=1 Tax=Vibrio metschnikovii TaxID=28172 RepID=UPI00164565AD|nr:OmpA family protein [Vibrio metschnikovii]MBC3619221.1 OmpA family protein [Vibrio metschnikovii]